MNFDHGFADKTLTVGLAARAMQIVREKYRKGAWQQRDRHFILHLLVKHDVVVAPLFRHGFITPAARHADGFFPLQQVLHVNVVKVRLRAHLLRRHGAHFLQQTKHLAGNNVDFTGLQRGKISAFDKRDGLVNNRMKRVFSRAQSCRSQSIMMVFPV